MGITDLKEIEDAPAGQGLWLPHDRLLAYRAIPFFHRPAPQDGVWSAIDWGYQFAVVILGIGLVPLLVPVMVIVYLGAPIGGHIGYLSVASIGGVVLIGLTVHKLWRWRRLRFDARAGRWRLLHRRLGASESADCDRDALLVSVHEVEAGPIPWRGFAALVRIGDLYFPLACVPKFEGLLQAAAEWPDELRTANCVRGPVLRARVFR